MLPKILSKNIHVSKNITQKLVIELINLASKLSTQLHIFLEMNNKAIEEIHIHS
jgi:hypothetical protein